MGRWPKARGYTQSDHVLDTSGKSVEQSQMELSQLIEGCQILNAHAG